MTSRLVVHLISRYPALLQRALEEGLGYRPEVRAWGTTPPRSTVRCSDIVIVDLEDLPQGVNPTALRHLVPPRRLCLILGDRPIPAVWVALVALDNVSVVSCPGARRTGGFTPVVSALADLLGRPTGGQIADMVITTEPSLAPADALVRAICCDPWDVRRPRDLAVKVGWTRGALRRACRQLGFARVEHFVISVRMLAVQQLITHWKLDSTLARSLAGVKDLSNTRRQLARARRGSSTAMQHLRSPVCWIAFCAGSLLSVACGGDGPTLAPSAQAAPRGYPPLFGTRDSYQAPLVCTLAKPGRRKQGCCRGVDPEGSLPRVRKTVGQETLEVPMMEGGRIAMAAAVAGLLLAVPYSVTLDAVSESADPALREMGVIRPNDACAAGEAGDCKADCGCDAGFNGCCVLPNGAVCLRN